MLVEHKYFPQDKNYLLKTVQAFSKECLIKQWIDETLNAYNTQHNPMGLEDDFTQTLRDTIHLSSTLLDPYYDLVAAIYRYDHGETQLTFQWDGRTHMEVYDAEWKRMYGHWIKSLSLIKEIQRPLIKYAVTGHLMNVDFLHQSIRRGILSHFNIRLRAQTLYRAAA